MTEWTYAALWESVAAALPNDPAVIQGDDTTTWAEFDRAANGLAAHLLDAGLGHQSKCAIYTHNCAEFMVATFASFKTGIVPFNVNYRYGSEEVGYLLDNGDAEAVVFETPFAALLEPVRAAMPLVKTWIAIARDGVPVPAWATDWESIHSRDNRVEARWGRHGDDMMFIYTGGTTGMPKAVMWRQGELIAKGAFGANPLVGLPPLDNPEQAGPRAKMLPVRPRSLIAPPLMHATGMIAAYGAFTQGGAILLLPRGSFSGAAVWEVAAQHHATRITIVGQPFAQPMLEALDAAPGRWDLSRVRFIGSSGAMWSRENKLALIAHLPEVTLIDSFSSSEAMGMGSSTASAAGETDTAKFQIGPDCAVFTEEGERVVPGSGTRGRLAVGGYTPAGYYKDEAKSATTFIEVEGRRWAMPGDWATVEADGTVTVLGRGSQCINTGGEKVFPEEVEEVLKRHSAVRDAAVCGLPDERFGEQVAALVELVAGQTADPTDLIAHVRSVLAAYKAPRHVLRVAAIPRAPNGKMDYASVKAQAEAAFGAVAA